MNKKESNKKKFWITLLIVFISLFLVLGLVLVNFVYNNFTRSGSIKKAENVISEYMKDKYGGDLGVEIVHFQGTHTGNMGDVWHTVVLEDNPNIKFEVNLDGFIGEKVVKDDRYEYGLLAYEEYKKLEPFIGNIENFGFSKHVDIMDDKKLKNYIEYEYDYSDTEEYILAMNITYDELNKEDILSEDFIDDLYSVIDIIKVNNIEVSNLNLGGNDTGILSFKLKDVSSIHNKEDLVYNLKNNNEEILSFLEMDRYEDLILGLENERFTFDNEYNDQWLECEGVSEGECVNYRIHVLYKDDGLRNGNIHLEEDLNLLLLEIDRILNSEEVDVYGHWKKYFILDLRDESRYYYNLDNDGYNEDDYRNNIKSLLNEINSSR